MSKKKIDINNENTDVSQNKKQKKNVAPKILGVFLAVVFIGLLLFGGYYMMYNPDGLESGTYYLNEDGVQNGAVWIKIGKARLWQDNSSNSGRYMVSEDKTEVSFYTKENGEEVALFNAAFSDTEDEKAIVLTVGDETFKYILGELEEKQEDEEVYFSENPLFAQKFTVTFDPAGGSGTGLEPQQVVKGRYVEFPELTRGQNEYVAAWTDEEGNTITAFTRVLSDLNLTAEWEREISLNYNLNYLSSDATEPEVLSKTTVKGKAAYIPEREGYVFTGWWYSQKLDKAVRGKVVLPDGEEEPLTLYAEWAIDTGDANQIAPPVVEVHNGVFSWESADGAKSYMIEVYRSETLVQTKELGSPSKAGTPLTWTFPASSLGAGEYEVKIKAISLNGTGYSNSAAVIKVIVK